MSERNDVPLRRLNIHFFKPFGESMRQEVAVARIVLGGWVFLSFGVPLLIFLFGLGDPSGLGASFLTRSRFLGFPLHYWLLAQGCTFGYVILCKLYCDLWDRRLRRPVPVPVNKRRR
ncbi:MAG: hypothetical protein C0621_01275 [Desulfuromonas sp.]|nr:MAG: hypothetical protein C0621_01275 [Desulfuromonas sp.]